jgi:hypothetical protein
MACKQEDPDMKNSVLVVGSPVRMVFNSAVDRLRIARDRRKQRQELIEYLTSDHRAANDLGITTYNVRNFFRCSSDIVHAMKRQTSAFGAKRTSNSAQ